MGVFFGPDSGLFENHSFSVTVGNIKFIGKHYNFFVLYLCAKSYLMHFGYF